VGKVSFCFQTSFGTVSKSSQQLLPDCGTSNWNGAGGGGAGGRGGGDGASMQVRHSAESRKDVATFTFASEKVLTPLIVGFIVFEGQVQ